MRKRKVGLLTFSDGRKFAHELQKEMNWDFQNKFRARLEATAEYEVVAGEEIVWHPSVAKREGRRLAEAGVEAHTTGLGSLFLTHFGVNPTSAEEAAAGDKRAVLEYGMALMASRIFILPRHPGGISTCHTQRDVAELVRKSGIFGKRLYRK